MKTFSPQSVPWLVEEDGSGISYLVLTDLLDVPGDDVRVVTARKIAYGTGFIGNILKHLKQEGYWVNPGGGLLAQIPLECVGADFVITIRSAR